MALLPPRVVGPLSPCSDAVLVEGALPGAEVAVFANDRLVANGTATSPSQVFSLLPGASLPPRSEVRAVQSLAGESSPNESEGVEVMLTPSVPGSLGEIAWRGRLHECGRCTVLVGAYPGARVQIVDAGTVLAEGSSVNTVVRLGLSHPIGSGGTLTATEQACGIANRGRTSPATVSFMNSVLPPPVVREPLLECMRRVFIGEVYEGAAVTLRRTTVEGDSVEGDRGCFDHPEEYIELAEGDRLRAGETFIARQGYPDCALWSDSSAEAIVQPLTALPAPEVLAPLCSNTTRLVVRNLIPDAVVRIFNNGTELGRAVAARDTDVFLVPPLVEGTVEASQELCLVVSPRSAPVQVVAGDAGLAPLITQPHECATVVHVRGVRPNARVRILSSTRGYIGEATAIANDVLVRVPSLSANESLFVDGTVCGVDRLTPSGPVIPLREVNPPTLQGTLLAGDREARLTGVLTGAIVEVFSQDPSGTYLRGSVESGTESVRVPIFGALREGEALTAVQRLCSRASSSSRPVTVRSCRGRFRVGLKTVVAALAGDLRRQFNWMRDLFGFHGFEVAEAGELEVLDLPRLEILRFDDRVAASELRSHRNGLGERDIAVYMIRMVIGGGGFHEAGTSGVVIQPSGGGEIWAAAHEVGHALGLPDVGGRGDRLMYGDPRIGGPEPDNFATALTEGELATIAASPLVGPCREAP